MEMKSKNMNYIFNVEYFEGLDFKNISNNDNESLLARKNEEIFGFKFPRRESVLGEGEKKGDYRGFSLYTLYPGLLIGIGNPHDVAVAGALKCGFTFDYVTGLPYITGSTLKGMLRAYFPIIKDAEEGTEDHGKAELIKGLFEPKKENLKVLKLKENMFENQDIFIGGFPVLSEEQALLEMEFITPHKEKFKNPNPISLVKVKPGVRFEFLFVFKDYKDPDTGEIIVTADEKLKLCKELLLLMGIGAKTNVGFGRFAKDEPKKNKLIESQQDKSTPKNHNAQKGNNYQGMSKSSEPPKCKNKGCNNVVTFNKGRNMYNTYCQNCFQKYKNDNKKGS